MRFASPYMLFFIWVAAGLLLLSFIGAARRKKILRRYVADEQGYERLTQSVSPRRRYLRSGMVAVSFVAVVFALAGPRYGYRWETVKQRGVDLVVALDCSRSMLATDIAPTRLDRAKHEIIDLLGMLTGDRIGLVAFAGEAFLQCPLTQDYSAFHIFLKALSPDFLPVGGTNLAAAVKTAGSAFDMQSNSDKAIILITDGESTAGSDPLEAARKIAEKKITLFCVGVGEEQGAPVPGEKGGFKKDAGGKIVLTSLDEKTLKKMAALTGGAYVRSVAGDMDLDAIYHQQVQKTMEGQTLESGRRRVWENRYQWFLALALLCLLAEMLVGGRRPAVLVLALLCLLGDPQNAGAGNVYHDVQQGKTAYENGKYEAALKHFIDAQLKAPEAPHIYYNIGDAYYKNGDYAAAEKNYQKGLSLVTENPSLKENLLYNLGNTRFRQGDYTGAIEYYEQALEIAPEDTQAKDNLELARKKKEEKQQKEKSRQDRNRRQSSQEPEKSEQQKSEGENGGQQQQEKSQEERREGQQKSEGQRTPRKEKKPSDEKTAASRKKQEAEDKPQTAAASEGKKSAKGDRERQAAGEKELQRLQDRPGAAMIPAYREHRVEKDW